MTVIVFADLDDSLFATEEKAFERSGGGALIHAASDRNGTPVSFHTTDQVALLNLLGTCTLIPVTGRNRVALERVVSPRFDDYQIVSHGALIFTPEGEPYDTWHRHIAAEAARWDFALRTLAERVRRRYEQAVPDLRVRVIEDEGLPVYVSVKVNCASHIPNAVALAELASDIGDGWRIHMNGRNAAYLPPYASKERAVAQIMEIKRRADPDTVFLGLGDSLSDVAFLKLCHYAIVPRYSQIHDIL